MRLTVAALLTMSVSTVCLAETAFQAPLVNESVLLDIAAKEYVVIVGERGHILTSDDGEVFKQMAVPTQSTLTATDMVGDHVWAVGHDASILHSADRGKTWEIQFQDAELQRPLLDILFFDESNGIAVGAYGLFYRTSDGGETWKNERHASLLAAMDREYLEDIRTENEEFYQQELNSILPHINRVTLDGERIYMAGEAGLLAYSDDKGESWNRYDVDYTGSFFDIRPMDEHSVIAVGLRGNVFVMRDGVTWDYVNTCSTSTLNSVYVKSEKELVAMGNNGMLVTASRPLPVSERDPYAIAEECKPAKGVSVRQLKDKAAILNAASFNGHIIAVSANGIKQLNLD